LTAINAGFWEVVRNAVQQGTIGTHVENGKCIVGLVKSEFILRSDLIRMEAETFLHGEEERKGKAKIDNLQAH
jgi:hypothetical protein